MSKVISPEFNHLTNLMRNPNSPLVNVLTGEEALREHSCPHDKDLLVIEYARLDKSPFQSPDTFIEYLKEKEFSKFGNIDEATLLPDGRGVFRADSGMIMKFYPLKKRVKTPGN